MIVFILILNLLNQSLLVKTFVFNWTQVIALLTRVGFKVLAQLRTVYAVPHHVRNETWIVL